MTSKCGIQNGRRIGNKRHANHGEAMTVRYFFGELWNLESKTDYLLIV